MAEKPHAFSRADAQRIIRAVRLVERYMMGLVRAMLKRRPRGAHWLPTLIGVLDEDLAKNGSATMSIWGVNNADSNADTEDNVEVYDWLLGGGMKLASGTRVVVTLVPTRRGGPPRYYVIAANACEVEA